MHTNDNIEYKETITIDFDDLDKLLEVTVTFIESLSDSRAKMSADKIKYTIEFVDLKDSLDKFLMSYRPSSLEGYQ